MGRGIVTGWVAAFQAHSIRRTMTFAMFTAKAIFVILLKSNHRTGDTLKSEKHGIAGTLCGLLSALLASAALGQNGPASSSPAEIKLKPILIHYSTLGGLRYSTEEEPLLNYKDLKELIDPLRDYEALRLLKVSESSGVKAEIFGGVGWAGLLTGIVGILRTPSSQQTGFWIAAIGGGVSIDISGFFRSESDTAKFNCVQRYNRFARGEEQVLPKTPADEKALLNFNSSNPAPSKTPVPEGKSK